VSSETIDADSNSSGVHFDSSDTTSADTSVPVPRGAAAPFCSPAAARDSLPTNTFIVKTLPEGVPRSQFVRTQVDTKYNWLVLDEKKGEYFCKVCCSQDAMLHRGQKDGKSKTLSTTPFVDFGMPLNAVNDKKNMDKLSKHCNEGSLHHSYLKTQKDIDCHQPKLAEAARVSAGPVRDSMIRRIVIAYFMAYNNESNCRYSSLTALLNVMNPGIFKVALNVDRENVDYFSQNTYNGFLSAIGTVLHQDMVADAKKSMFFGLSSDESTLHRKNYLAVSLSYLDKDLVLQQRFVAMVNLPDGSADTVYSANKEVLAKNALDTAKLSNIGGDGAAVNSGRLTGMATQFREKDNKCCVFNHCACHKNQV
jgi:hypothetical protein